MKCIPGGVLEGVRVRPRSEPHRHGSFSPHGLGQVFSFECRGCKIRGQALVRKSVPAIASVSDGSDRSFCKEPRSSRVWVSGAVEDSGL